MRPTDRPLGGAGCAGYRAVSGRVKLHGFLQVTRRGRESGRLLRHRVRRRQRTLAAGNRDARVAAAAAAAAAANATGIVSRAVPLMRRWLCPVRAHGSGGGWHRDAAAVGLSSGLPGVATLIQATTGD